MIVLTSPAKTLDLSSTWDENITQPIFLKEAALIAQKLKILSKQKLTITLNVSEKLGELNYQRFQDWENKHTRKNSRPAILTYKGDVYRPLSLNYSKAEKEYLQKSLRIITGLYGLLRPYDLMQAYRLEMKIALKVKDKNNLYEYWKEKITADLKNDLKTHENKIVVDLASNEYSKAVDLNKLGAEVIHIEFR